MSTFSLNMEEVIKIEEESKIRKHAAFTKVYDAISSLDIFGSTDETENNSPQLSKTANTAGAHVSANYVSVKAIYDQSNNEKISFSEQIRSIQQEKLDDEIYKLQRDQLRKRHDHDCSEEEGFTSTAVVTMNISSTIRSHSMNTQEKVNAHLALDNNFISESALQEIESYYGLTPRPHMPNEECSSIDDNQKQSTASSSSTAVSSINDPDLADVFTYLDSTTTTARRKKMSSASELEALIRLRDRSSYSSDDRASTAMITNTTATANSESVTTANLTETTE